MNAPLPTARELEKLPLRALVVYAARTARRLSQDLRGVVSDEILDDALRLIETVSTAEPLGVVDKAAVIRAAERVAGAYADAPDDLKSAERFRIVFSVGHAAETAMFALLAATDPSGAPHWLKDAADEAERAVRALEVLGGGGASAAREAARRDYDILVRKYGKHEEVVIGDPVDHFEDE
jgi:hypothetical protein